ncbi:hypothetical protein ZIOFF_074333 (mitochondrion) [Zingiber officinale]|uniref:Ribulose bisphosphate carboxylase large chain n=1 Tax=Zingiber officinale TaxID=94328 RepID=A0A8J5B903_ZINOF|nr:hypothetical protein ZIOFF_075505 [Zingiber officinale]KAG6467681.1 hypothetical protein ZIOFF_074481 [Zingiber officinale]KAG6467815.1 hypothetical protein ZIOFF_074333 [Zingiber officinale]
MDLCPLSLEILNLFPLAVKELTGLTFRVTPQPYVPPEEAGAAVAAEESTGTWTTVWTDGLTSLDRYKGRCYHIEAVVGEDKKDIAYLAYPLDLKKVLLLTCLLPLWVMCLVSKPYELYVWRIFSFPQISKARLTAFRMGVLRQLNCSSVCPIPSLSSIACFSGKSRVAACLGSAKLLYSFLTSIRTILILYSFLTSIRFAVIVTGYPIRSSVGSLHRYS